MTGTPPSHNPDYLAKDFNSFRQLLFDHLAALAPESAPFEVASLESTLVEILAYAGDYLSYYQDAVATEAYLSTARRRVSLRRHARLLDYAPNEGCSARVWARIEVSAETMTVPRGARLLTGIAGVAPGVLPAGFDPEGREVFETMHEARFARAHNRMALAGSTTLSPGDTSARLDGYFPGLARGDVLIFSSASPGHAHAVRLKTVSAKEEEKETAIAWHDEDALPAGMPERGCHVLGNIVLADHGLSGWSPLPEVSREGVREIKVACPHLAFTVPYRHDEAILESAAAAMRQEPNAAEPAIGLAEESDLIEDKALDRRPLWTGRRDLVHASQFDRAFAAEPEGDGTVNLRFGDGVHGRRLQPDWDYRLNYRTGIGTRGNIGANTLAHIVSADERILSVGNPIAASGGCDPESLDDIRALAPIAADEQRRCVTPEDYVATVCDFPGVSGALAARAWTPAGSIVTIHVRRDRDQALDQPFAERLAGWLDSFTLIGDALDILGPVYVVPDIALELELEPGQVRSEIVAAVRSRLVETMNLSFGEELDPERVVACALQVPGVVSATIVRCGRKGDPSSTIAPAPVKAAANEIIRLEARRIELDTGKTP